MLRDASFGIASAAYGTGCSRDRAMSPECNALSQHCNGPLSELFREQVRAICVEETVPQADAQNARSAMCVGRG